MARAGQTITHPVTGEELTYLRTSADTGGRVLEVDFRVKPGGAPAAPHIHPQQVERFQVQSGRMRVITELGEQVVGPGEQAVIQPGVAHIWVAEGDEQVVMRVSLEPALTSERFFEEFFGLAEAGKVNAKGMPNLLRIAVLLRDYPDTIYLAKPPIAVQKVLFALLAPFGRALGYGQEHAHLSAAS